MAEIAVDQTACIRCGACVDVCLIANVFELGEDASTVVRPEDCWTCGQCVAVCPTDAIDLDAFPPEECPIVDPEDFPSLESLVVTVRARRSCRTFQTKPVPRETVRELISIARWAPSAHNSQALDWIAFDDRARIAELSKATTEQLQRYARLLRNPFTRLLLHLTTGRELVRRARRSAAGISGLEARAARGEDPIFFQAPVVLVGHGPRGNPFGRDDAIYATYNLMLAAERLSLGTCQIGLFQAVIERSARVRRAVGLPERRVPQVAVALGHPRHAFRRLLPRRPPNLSWNPR
jgi:nitroreductase/NAD-dependent dihydropyrimidine dehydrogenase PreA subunit